MQRSASGTMAHSLQEITGFVKMGTKLTIGTIVTLALIASGAFFVDMDADAYYCESKDMVMLCSSLSSGTGTRCYYESTYKICREGWVELTIGQEIDIDPGTETVEVPPSTEGTKWKCSPERCVGLG